MKRDIKKVALEENIGRQCRIIESTIDGLVGPIGEIEAVSQDNEGGTYRYQVEFGKNSPMKYISRFYPSISLCEILTDNLIGKGDMIRCLGIGYPHWKDEEFECEVVFPDNTIGLDNKIRVASSDFEKIKKE